MYAAVVTPLVLILSQAAMLTVAQAALTTQPPPLSARHPALPITTVSDALGVPGADIGKAGNSRASRMTYLGNLIQETRWNVFARCSEVLKLPDGPAEAVSFCRDVMPSP